MDSVGPMIVPGPNDNLILGLVRPDQLRRMLTFMLDENEFLSPYGVRSVSRHHKDHPMVLNLGGQEYRLDYEPGESQSSLFGGNSNWRGPIWMPVNFLILLALQQYHLYYGEEFRVECPTGSGNRMNLEQVVQELGRRLANIFLLDGNGRRAVFGSRELFNTRSELARPDPVPRVLPRRHRPGLRRQPPDRLDGVDRPDPDQLGPGHHPGPDQPGRGPRSGYPPADPNPVVSPVLFRGCQLPVVHRLAATLTPRPRSRP